MTGFVHVTIFKDRFLSILEDLVFETTYKDLVQFLHNYICLSTGYLNKEMCNL